jgi:hypothetical protein
MAERASPRSETRPSMPTAATWGRLRRVLLDERGHILRRITPLDDPLESAPEDCRRLNDVYLALDRMRRGTYGRCVACATPMPVTVLDERPHAARCGACGPAPMTGPHGMDVVSTRGVEPAGGSPIQR